MTIKAKSLIAALCAAGVISATAYGADTTQAQITSLKQQVNALQKQIAVIERNSQKPMKAANKTTSATSATSTTPEKVFGPYAQLGNYVVVAPFTGTPMYNTGSTLLTNAPSINEDAKLLYRRYSEQQKAKELNITMPEGPRLVLSGKAEGQAIYQKPYTGSNTSDIDLSSAELDAFAEVSPWVNAFLGMTYDNNPSESDLNRRISNSRIYMDKAFLTIGNFNKSNFYGSLGQVYVPFGRYSTAMISDPLPKFIGKTKARAITLGYVTDPYNTFAPYARVFVFNGDAKYGNSGIVKENGLDLGFNYNFKKLVFTDLGMSYLSDLAEAAGIQNNGRSASSTGFRGFEFANSESIVHRVGGLDAHASLNIKKFNFLAEYTGAMQAFSPVNVSYNGHGAKPRAYSLEAGYVFKMFQRPTSFSIGYSRSSQALAWNIPKQRYLATLAVTLLNFTTVSLEFRHDKNYSKGDTATGNITNGSTIAYNPDDLGQVNNAVTAKIGVYF